MPRPLKLAAPVFAILTVAIATVASGAVGGPAAHPKAGHLSMTYRFDSSHGVPTEGSISYLVLKRTPGGQVLSAELTGTDSLSTPVPAGRYHVSAFQRTCSGNCETLDPPSYTCGRDVRVHAGERVRARILVRWVTSATCRISISR